MKTMTNAKTPAPKPETQQGCRCNPCTCKTCQC